MNKIKHFIENYLGELSILVGSFLSIYNLLNFSSDLSTTLDYVFISRIEKMSREPNNLVVSYYYDNQEMILIAIGVCFVILGIFLIRKKKLNKIL